jgi:transmembrane sensor
MDSISNPKDVAAKWIARRASEDWSTADEAQLDRWLAASPTNLITFLRLEAAWNEADRLKVLGAGIEPGVVPSLEHFRASPFFKPLQAGQAVAATRSTRPAPQRRLKFFATAAAILVVVAAGLFTWSTQLPTAYSTPIGGTAAVPLADGSKVTLNTDSRIRVDVTDAQRRVKLDHGEAFFDVAKDPSRPFTVLAGNKRITVLGTKFSVRRERDDVQVVVTEGLVRMEHDGAAGEVPEAELTAGTVARAKDGNVVISKRTVTQTQELLSWRVGYVVFHETPLDRAAAEFNRYNKRQIVVADPAVNEVTISGNFRATNVESFARLLAEGFPVEVELRADTIVLTKHHSQ